MAKPAPDESAVLYIRPMAGRIMEALTIHRFLSIEQMIRLGIGSRVNISAALNKDLLACGFVACTKLGSLHDPDNARMRGLLPRLFFLTRDGAKAYETATGLLPGSVNFPYRPAFNVNTQLHKLRLIDCHIAVRQWAESAEQVIDFFELDFFTEVPSTYDTRAPLPKRKTELLLPTGQILVPDGAFQLTDHDGKARLYLLELYNGRKHVADHFVPQLMKHCHAITGDAVRHAFGYEHGERVLAVFTDPGAVELTKAALLRAGVFAEFAEHFYLTSFAKFTADFRGGWMRLEPGLPGNLF